MSFHIGDHAGFEAGGDRLLEIIGEDLLAGSIPDLDFQRLGVHGLAEREFDATDRVVFFQVDKQSLGKPIARSGRFEQDRGHLVAEFIGGALGPPSQREDQQSHQVSCHWRREIAKYGVEAFFDDAERILEYPLGKHQVLRTTALILVVLDNRGTKIQVAENIAKARRQFLAAFEFAAQHQHRDIRNKGECCAHSRQAPLVMGQGADIGNADQAGAAQRVNHGADRVADRKPDMPEHCPVEIPQTLFRVFVGNGEHFCQDIGMATNRPLAKDNHAASQDVGAFDRNRHRYGAIGRDQVVARPATDRAAAMDVHRVVQTLTHTLGVVIFQYRRQNRGFFAERERRRSQAARGIHAISQAGDAG